MGRFEKILRGVIAVSVLGGGSVAEGGNMPQTPSVLTRHDLPPVLPGHFEKIPTTDRIAVASKSLRFIDQSFGGKSHALPTFTDLHADEQSHLAGHVFEVTRLCLAMIRNGLLQYSDLLDAAQLTDLRRTEGLLHAKHVAVPSFEIVQQQVRQLMKTAEGKKKLQGMYQEGRSVFGSRPSVTATPVEPPSPSVAPPPSSESASKIWRSNSKPSLNAWNDGGVKREGKVGELFGLKNFKDASELRQAREDGRLVDLKPGPEDGYEIADDVGQYAGADVKELFHCLAPYAAEQFTALAREFTRHFRGAKLVVGSAVRSERYVDLMRKSGEYENLADKYTSSHLFGYTLDVKVRTMTPVQREWMRKKLLGLEGAGLAEATEEHHVSGNVFHMMFVPEQESPTKNLPVARK